MNKNILKSIAALVAAAILAAALPLSVFAVEPLAACDINGDGRVSASDARTILRIAAQLEEPVPTTASEQVGIEIFGDLNGDGRVTASDGRLMLRYHAQLIDFSQLKINIRQSGAEPSGTEPIVPATEQPQLPSRKLLDNKTNHALGTARMVCVTSDYGETMPDTYENDKSSPLATPYVKGTYAYVDGTDTFDSDLHYFLTCGTKICYKDVSFTSSGYVMPENKLSIAAVVKTERTTDIYIATDWLVPTAAAYLSQKYVKGYDGREFNVNSFTATGLAITFFHTSSASGAAELSGDPVLKGAAWSKSSEGMVLTLNFLEAGKFNGYMLSVTDNGYIKLSVKHKTPGIAGKIIVLDAGHGGSDSGGGDSESDTYEAPINAIVVSHAAAILRKAGATVLLSNEFNKDVTLVERVAFSRKYDADLFVSIHCNAAGSTSASGADVFYYNAQTYPFARILQDKLVSCWQGIYKETDANYSKIDRGTPFYPFAVTRAEHCPSVLAELGFLTNGAEREKLTDATVQAKLADAVAQACIEYFS